MPVSKNGGGGGGDRKSSSPLLVHIDKPSSVPKNLAMQLNGEALTALEESLKMQIEMIKDRRKAHERIIENIAHEHQRSQNDVMSNTEALKNKVDDLSDQTKVVIVERDEAMQELRNVEQSFSDVHRKYERAKVILQNLKENEEHLKQRDDEIMLLIQSRDQKFEAFKQEAQDRIEKMYFDFTAKIAALDNENARLGVQLRRAEMRVETLVSELEHKQRENAELNNLADELIGRSVPHS